MAKKEDTQVAVVETPKSLIPAVKNSMAPSFATEGAIQGVSGLDRIIRPARLKVVQGSKSDKYKDYKTAQVVMTPAGTVLAEPDEPFYVVPLLHYPEWACVNPYEMRGTLKMIRERTLDIRSSIAAKAMDEKKRNSEVCPEDNMFSQQNRGQYRLKYKEYNVFICWLIAKGDIQGQPVLVSFSGGEYGTGAGFAALIKSRGAHIYSTVFEMRAPSQPRSRNGYTWHGIDPMNPTSPGCPHPFVQERADFDQFKQLHDSYVSTYMRGVDGFEADLGEDDIADEVAAGEGKF